MVISKYQQMASKHFAMSIDLLTLLMNCFVIIKKTKDNCIHLKNNFINIQKFIVPMLQLS